MLSWISIFNTTSKSKNRLPTGNKQENVSKLTPALTLSTWKWDFATKSRGDGRSKNKGGSSYVVGIFCPPSVGIGFTDLPKTGGGRGTLTPRPLPAPLERLQQQCWMHFWKGGVSSINYLQHFHGAYCVVDVAHIRQWGWNLFWRGILVSMLVEVSFIFMSTHKKISPNFKIQLSHWSTFGSIICMLTYQTNDF